MTYGAVALAYLLASCKASYVAVGTQASIIKVESSNSRGIPESNAIHDNTTGASYWPATREQASVLAKSLLRAGHSLDVGIGQLNNSNFAGIGVGVDDVLDPCINVRVTGELLERDWLEAFSAVGYNRARERQAIFMTASLYNKNSLFGAPAYVRNVVDASQTGYVRTVVAAYRSIVARAAAAQRKVSKAK